MSLLEIYTFLPTRPHRLVVRTSLFQGGDTGSNPVGATFIDLMLSKEAL